MSKVRWVNGQAFAPHYDWECYTSGFHSVAFNQLQAEQSRDLYANIPELRIWTFTLLEAWPVTVAVHLSQNRNYRAWIGHAACFLHHGAGMDSSIAAYWMLDERGRDDANNCVMEGFYLWTLTNTQNLQSGSSLSASGQLEFQFWRQQGSASPPLSITANESMSVTAQEKIQRSCFILSQTKQDDAGLNLASL